MVTRRTRTLSFAVIVPTLNAEVDFRKFLPAFAAQAVKPNRFLVLDSESTDQTVAMAEEAGAEVVNIKRTEFNHGATRMLGIACAPDCDIVVFLTQDAILADRDALGTILKNFLDDRIGVAYGRQLPRPGAGPIERFARLYNYPDRSEERSAADVARLGFKVSFCSNSFAAYRVSRLSEVGGFPDDTIFGEDALAVAKMILAGSVVNYDARATVYHSHHYTVAEEFRRYFDIGVMHSRWAGLLKPFGSPSSAGRDFVLKEFTYLATNSPLLIPEAAIRTAIKYIAYKIGKMESRIPPGIKRKLSRHSAYWTNNASNR